MHWDNVNFKEPQFIGFLSQDLVKLDFFSDWLVGFSMAEGSFGIKANGSAFFQIIQKGDDNIDLLKAACLIMTEIASKRDAYPMKAESVGSYQLALSSPLSQCAVAGRERLIYKKWFLSFHHLIAILYMDIN